MLHRLVLGLLLAATSAAAAQPEGGPPPASVTLDPARTEAIEQWREVTGELRVVRRSIVASRQDGQVVEMLVDDGEAVEAGAVLARLDPTLASLAVAQEAARVAAQQGVVARLASELEKSRRDWTRYEGLGANGSVSGQELDDIQTATALSEASSAEAAGDLASARAALAAAQERLAQMIVVAPFAGRVVRKQTEVGQWLQAGDPVAEVVALDQIEARLNVPESIAAGLKEGESTVRVRVRALGAEATGVVGFVLPEADAMSRLFPVRVVLANADGRMRPGMSIVGLIGSGLIAPSLTVAKDAILRDDAGEFLYFDAGGRAAVARVRTLFASGDRVAIAGGLPPGANVVVSGNERLFPGQPLAIILAAPPAAAPAQPGRPAPAPSKDPAPRGG